jgi:N,N'-diacetyllegionaminate synthase
MSTLAEIGDALSILEESGLGRNQVVVLHCTTEYPTPFNEVNLAAMANIRRTFGVKVGYSDHTSGTEVSIAAVALGACVIEKHFTMDRLLVGPDHKASLQPDELASLVSGIRNVETSIGSEVKAPTASEIKNITTARKSLVAGENIKKGELLSVNNVVVKRPGGGISPMHWDRLIGEIAVRDYLADEMIDQ